jgi:uncharacterized membrane protein YgcG
MSDDPHAKSPHRPGFGHRTPVVPLPPPEAGTGIGPILTTTLTKRSTVVALVLAGSAVFLAYNVRYQQSCKAPVPGASPELLAEFERCRTRRTSSSSGRSYSWSSGGSSSSATHSTAARGGFGGSASGHASGG